MILIFSYFFKIFFFFIPLHPYSYHIFKNVTLRGKDWRPMTWEDARKSMGKQGSEVGEGEGK